MRVLLTVFVLVGAHCAAAVGQVDLSHFEGLKARNIGPAGMSGRVTAIRGASGDPNTIYLGGAAGGVWMSEDGGITWSPIFDDQEVASIGALALDPGNPDVLWVGTGEGNPRNSASVGAGVYRSRDRGRNWSRMGLEASERIHRVLIHPRRPNTVYVCAMGPLWSDGPQRGVFRTRDGGRHWDKVLYADARTGCADLVLDPDNPDKLIAALWEHRRTPAFMTSGGPGSGIHLTFDGGDTWTRLSSKDGLPSGDLGRTGLAIAPGRPQTVYALVEATKSALLRSDDGGRSWHTVNDSRNVNPRPFYYADIRVDPSNENRLYELHGQLTVSDDGGKSFRSLVPSATIHGDYHALWIDPDDPSRLIAGNDGGVAISRDRGRHWRFVANLPLGQFYHVAVDDLTPYNVYGGLQDNGSWRGPSQVWSRRGIENHYWRRLATGDGFDVQPDPRHPERFGYAMSQGGSLVRYDLLTGQRKSIRPVHPEGVRLRFSWNAALAVDPHDPAVIYYGSQFVHRSDDSGHSWTLISGDLTSNDPERQRQMDSGGLTYDVTAAENNTTLVVIAPSPLQAGVIWTGSDDGRVHLTRSGGRDWSDLSGNLPGLPAGAWIPHIEPSPHDPAEAFLVADDHRRGDWTPYVYRTTDWGVSWSRLSVDGVRGYPLVLRQDPEQPKLLFLGTEFGLWISFDLGRIWSKWTQGLPTTSVMDLVIHPREHDLVIATHGRALFIIDDIRPLRRIAEDPSLMQRRFTAFGPGRGIEYIVAEPAGLRAPGHAEFQGKNRPYGAALSYWIGPFSEESPAESDNGAESDEDRESSKDGASGENAESDKGSNTKVKIEVLDGDSTVIRTLVGPADEGLQRVYWALDHRAVASFGRPPRAAGRPGVERGGRKVVPGEYRVRFTFGDEQTTRKVMVEPDPRQPYVASEVEAKDGFLRRVEEAVQSLDALTERLEEARRGVDRVNELIPEEDDSKMQELRRRGREVKKRIKELLESIRGGRVQGIRRDPDLPSSRLRGLLFSSASSWDAPTQSELWAWDQAQEKLRGVQERVEAFFGAEWKSYSSAVKEASLSRLP